MEVKDENYFVVQGWMINRLGLKGTTLNVFAIIYGYSQTTGNEFRGSRKYLCDFTGATKPTIDKSLNDLIDMGLIIKNSVEQNNVILNSYRVNLDLIGGKETLLVVKNLDGGSKETLLGGKETLPNKYNNNNNINDNIYNKEEKKILKEKQFDIFWNEYPKKINKQGVYKAFMNIKDLDKIFDKIIQDVKLKKTQWKEYQYIPYPLTYIHQRRWEEETPKLWWETDEFKQEQQEKEKELKEYLDSKDGTNKCQLL